MHGSGQTCHVVCTALPHNGLPSSAALPSHEPGSISMHHTHLLIGSLLKVTSVNHKCSGHNFTKQFNMPDTLGEFTIYANTRHTPIDTILMLLNFP